MYPKSIFWLLTMICLLLITACASDDIRKKRPRGLNDAQARVITMEATGYCRCGSCCGWERNWFGRPVFSSGPNKGQRKPVGITASGTRARPGTIAADTRRYPFGTIMHIPGYGYGIVEDRGGAIKGNKIDLYFRTHQQALEWGRQSVRVKVWPPPR
jgi:3D (Asp-Asp-Asp) domain-containing protein